MPAPVHQCFTDDVQIGHWLLSPYSTAYSVPELSKPTTFLFPIAVLMKCATYNCSSLYTLPYHSVKLITYSYFQRFNQFFLILYLYRYLLFIVIIDYAWSLNSAKSITLHQCSRIYVLKLKYVKICDYLKKIEYAHDRGPTQ